MCHSTHRHVLSLPFHTHMFDVGPCRGHEGVAASISFGAHTSSPVPARPDGLSGTPYAPGACAFATPDIRLLDKSAHQSRDSAIACLQRGSHAQTPRTSRWHSLSTIPHIHALTRSRPFGWRYVGRLLNLGGKLFPRFRVLLPSPDRWPENVACHGTRLIKGG